MDFLKIDRVAVLVLFTGENYSVHNAISDIDTRIIDMML